MIIFKEKLYTKPGLAGKLKRAMVPALRLGTGMEKKQAIKTVAAGSVYGPKAAGKHLAKHAKENPGAVIGGATTVLTPVPTVLGVHTGMAVQKGIKKAATSIRATPTGFRAKRALAS